MTTPRGAPELAESQALPATTVNEQIRRTEAGACFFPVTDRLTTPPGTCSDGANYIITATATGAWASKENQIATAVGANASNGWYYHTPVEGFTAYVMDENARYLFDGSAWAVDSSGGSAITAKDEGTNLTTNMTSIDFVGAGVTATNSGGAVTVTISGGGGSSGFGAFSTLTDAATVTPDATSTNNFFWTIGGNRTLANPTGLTDGQEIRIIIKQDGTGSRTWTLGSKYKFSGGAPALSTAANAIDLMVGIYNSAQDILVCSLGKGFS